MLQPDGMSICKVFWRSLDLYSKPTYLLCQDTSSDHCIFIHVDDKLLAGEKRSLCL